MNINKVKLARMILKFGEVNTDQGVLIYEGDIDVDTQVFIESEGEIIPAPDGDYKVDDITYKVVSGVVTEVINGEPVENADEPGNEPSNEPGNEPGNEPSGDLEKENEELKAENEELKAKIEELEAKIAEMENSNLQMSQENEELKNKLEMSNEKPAHIQIKDYKDDVKALKYFN